jgi:hypothetical protein
VEGKARGVEWSARPHLPSLQKGLTVVHMVDGWTGLAHAS